MEDTESDEDIIVEFEEESGNHSDVGETDSGDGEPPRRRMRLDADLADAATGGLTLRSRTVQRAGRGICLNNAVPSSTSHSHNVENSELIEEDVRRNRVSLDDDSSSTASNSSVALSYGSHSTHFVPSPTSSVLSGFSGGRSNTIDLDLDVDYQSVDSFESYNLDELSDVPVNRSPELESPSATDESVDGESLFGTVNDEENGENQASVEGEGNESHSRIWVRRRLQRRNAIILDNTDSRGSENETSQEAVESTVTKANVAGSSKLATDDPSCPPTDCSENRTSPKDEDDTEASNCIICCEPYANSGDHRLCCLKCGHTYGKFCIEKWIKSEARCPQCNSKASKKDVRVLYVRNLKALDTAERDRLRTDLEAEREIKRKLELRNSLLDQQVKEIDNKYKQLSKEYLSLRERVSSVYGDVDYGQHSNTASTTTGIRSKPLLTLLNSFPCKDGECRVGAYDDWLNMLAVSQTVKSPLYPLGSYGVKKINLLDMRETVTTPLHLKEIRDMEFNSQGDVLLSVGLDKRAILTNCNTSITVQTFTSDYPLWSCAWSKSLQQHLFYAGTSNGQVLVYDIRNGKEAVKSLTPPCEDKTPTAGLKFVPPSYKGSSSNFFSMTGLLVQKLTSVWFCEFRNEDVKFHQLPIEGSFLSVDFEPVSRHVLFSTKASYKGGSVPGRQVVCNLTQYHSTVQQSTIASCNIIQSYDGTQGSPLQATKMTRSSIFSPNEEKVLISAEIGGGSKHMTSIWNLSETQPQQKIPGREQVLGFVPCRVNNDFLLGSISANNLNVYKLQL